MEKPICPYRFEPVEGKPNCFKAVDKATGKVFNVARAIERVYNDRAGV